MTQYKRHKRRSGDRLSKIMGVLLAVIILLSAYMCYRTVLYFIHPVENLPQTSSGTNNISSQEPSSQEPSSSEEPPSQEPSSETSVSSIPEIPRTTIVPQTPEVGESYFKDAVFVGDSITEGIGLYSVLDTTVIANTGINVQTILTKEAVETEDGRTITFLQAMKEANPKKIYIMLGANGIAWYTEKSFVGYYQQFIQEVKQAFPNALIYVQSILPVTASLAQSDSRFSNEKIDTFNQDILAMCEEEGVYYLNVAEAIKNKNGALDEDASRDGIHFGVSTYNKWFDYLKTHAYPYSSES